MSKLNHFNESGGAHMVDITAKSETVRIAVATGRIRMQPATTEVIRSGRAQKGDVLGVAQIAGIMAAKNTPQIIPMCHPIMLTGTDVAFNVLDDAVEITATVKTTGKTGVEMEAMTAVSVAALTIYDMVKAMDRGMTIENIQVETKSGGASGDWNREEEDADSCADGSCAVDFGGEAPQVNLDAFASIRAAGNLTKSEKTDTDS